MPAPLRPQDPTRLGEYALLGRLGAGGQGVVYLATGPSGERVALKLLRSDLATDTDARVAFAREVDAARQVARFCAAQILDSQIDGDQPYVVSEYVDGPSLHQLVDNDGPRRGGALERLAINTATALVSIHEAGVIHRDLKPSNVLIGPDGPRVVDFGIARALDATMSVGSGILGTPAYMAPELFSPDLAEPTGRAADVFAWAATIAYAATGRAPFGSDSPPAVMQRVMNEPPDLGTEDEIPEPLRGLLLACLAKDPRDRPSARGALARLLGGDSAPAAPATLFARRRRMRAPAAARESGQVGPGPPGVPPGTSGVAGVPDAASGRRRRWWLLPVGTTVGVVGLLAGGYLVGPNLLDGNPGDGRTNDRSGSADRTASAPRPPRVEPLRAGEYAGPVTLFRNLDGLVTLNSYGDAYTRTNWDPDTGDVVRSDDRTAWEPSPNGRWIVRHTDEPTPAEVVVSDRATGESTTVRLGDVGGALVLDDPMWAADGDRLLFTARPTRAERTYDRESVGFVVVDPATGKGRLVDTASSGFEANRFYWNQNGTRVLSNLDVLTSDTLADVQVYALDGTPTRRLGQVGVLANEGLGPVSLDGTRILTYCEREHENFIVFCVYNSRTGAQLARVPVNAGWYPPDDMLLGWYDSSRVMVRVRGSEGHVVQVHSIPPATRAPEIIVHTLANVTLDFARTPSVD